MLDADDLDVMIVVGGYNSSNTQALASMCAPRVPTFHIDNPVSVEASAIRYRPVGGGVEEPAAGAGRHHELAVRRLRPPASGARASLAPQPAEANAT